MEEISSLCHKFLFKPQYNLYPSRKDNTVSRYKTNRRTREWHDIYTIRAMCTASFGNYSHLFQKQKECRHVFQTVWDTTHIFSYDWVCDLHHTHCLLLLQIKQTKRRVGGLWKITWKHLKIVCAVESGVEEPTSKMNNRQINRVG